MSASCSGAAADGWRGETRAGTASELLIAEIARNVAVDQVRGTRRPYPQPGQAIRMCLGIGKL